MPDQHEAGDAVVTPADIRLAAMNLLARREHSLWELRRKLRRRFSDAGVLDEQLARLTEENLQSDLRFAESYAHQRIYRGYGPLRLREELRQRGVSKTDIAQTMAALEVDWCQHAAQVLENKFGKLSPTDLKDAARRARFMQHRGFTAEHYREPWQD
ncbi:MAG: regulatory protein RecX [Halioglobus sp.]|nr:regulatory protein RecX [Halioglobus sp.]